MPPGAVGSLTHKRDQSLAIVARAEEFLSLGVDLEWDVEDESPDVALEVCTTRERARLPRIAASCRAPATLVLSAKEAFYKAQFPVCGVRLDWHDIEVRFDSGTFRVRALERLDLRARRAVGRYAVLSGWVITVVALQK